MLRSAEFGRDYPELRLTWMDETFEVDGILYTPPWMVPSNPDEPSELSVHYSPMFDLKEEFYYESF